MAATIPNGLYPDLDESWAMLYLLFNYLLFTSWTHPFRVDPVISIQPLAFLLFLSRVRFLFVVALPCSRGRYR